MSTVISIVLLAAVLSWPLVGQSGAFAVVPTRGIATWAPDVQVGHAFFMQKPEPTAVLTGPVARVTGVEAIRLTALGFDYRTDGHCGAGAPRFNVVTEDGVLHFFGCHYGSHSAVPGLPNWQRVRFSAADGYPSGGFASRVRSIGLEFDEGPDQGPGLVYLTNFLINDTVINQPIQQAQ